jgi:hypothetical protein
MSKPTIIIQSGFRDRGVTALVGRTPYLFRQKAELMEGEVPLGSVEWVEEILGRTVTPDYFPEFLHGHIHRTWRTDTKWPVGERCFIKPSHRHKAWKAEVYSGHGDISDKSGPYLISEVSRFRNEYRYYVANGKVLSGWWYWGDSQCEEQVHEDPEVIPDAPILPDIAWPRDYCGAVDFGELWDTGEIALIEANAPFSCGWYGESSHIQDYITFLVAGWRHILSTTT